jgi:hypothetical protein
MGTIRTLARAFEVFAPQPYAQYPVSVRVFFHQPRKRLGSSFLDGFAEEETGP